MGENVELKQSVKFMKKYIGDDYTFIINRAKVPDRGEFIIRAENHYGVSEEPVFLNVQAAPTDIKPYQPDPLPVRKREPKKFRNYNEERDAAPIFTFHLRPRIIQEGQTCKLLACATGQPHPQSNGTKDQRSLNKTSSPSLTPMVSSPSRLSMHNLETLENTNAQPLINWERTPQTAQLLWRAHNIAVALLSPHLQMLHTLMAFQMVIKPCKCPCNQFNDDEK